MLLTLNNLCAWDKNLLKLTIMQLIEGCWLVAQNKEIFCLNEYKNIISNNKNSIFINKKWVLKL